MAEIRAFRGYRYDLGRVGALSDVIAPPYDVIDPRLQERLYERSPYNVIRLILNKEETGDNQTHNRYSRAAGFLRDWQRDGILRQDSTRALYVYHQEFDVEGRRYLRRGFLGRIRLEAFSTGKIFPHEETLAGPKADRLNLFRATRANLSPVFGLYPDEPGAVQAQLDAVVQKALPIEAVDHLGVINRLWPVVDQHVVSTMAGLLGPKPVFIADGHHRYETALRYLEERRAAGDSQATSPEGAANFLLMMLVSMSDSGLIILPTHRLVFNIPTLTAEHLRTLLGDDFHFETVGRDQSGARDTWALIEAEGSQRMLGFGTIADGIWQTARYTGGPEVMAQLAPGRSLPWRELAVSLLHILVLEKLLAKGLNCRPECRYVHLLGEVNQAVSNRECQLAVLVPAATMPQVEQIAGNREKMPPKSTYFYPKLLSGLVFNPLTGS